jgi:hypothetical protein
MPLKQVLDILELLDRPDATGSAVARLFAERGLAGMEVKAARSRRGSTSFVKLTIPGTRGKAMGGKAPTLGIIGFLGGVGARPEVIGLVSDADGAVASLAAGLKLVDMYRAGDRLDGDVILCTHISPNSPIIPHEPVPFMSSPVSMATMKRHMVDERMDAVLSLDTTKGNRIINTRGFAISPTVKEGYILRVSEDLLTVQQNVTGRVPSVFAITTQDVTPYGNRLFHLNSIMQPASTTNAPVVGVAVTTEAVVPGCASGASHEVDIELAARFVVEVAKGFGRKSVRFYDAAEFSRLVKLYGSMKHLQTLGNQEAGSGSAVRRRTRVRRGDE